jgi:hypothetical protein
VGDEVTVDAQKDEFGPRVWAASAPGSPEDPQEMTRRARGRSATPTRQALAGRPSRLALGLAAAEQCV